MYTGLHFLLSDSLIQGCGDYICETVINGDWSIFNIDHSPFTKVFMELIFTISNISAAAEQFWQQANGRRVFAFYGAMGAGKTTFIHALCDLKKVSSTVGSPTFSIINEYRYPEGKIFHIDLYRLKDEEEAIRAGVEDCLYSGEIVLIEWPEKASGILPEETVSVHIYAIDPETRKINF
jgi:tRNA threonylcarbamoyladenosine biosynthesis protein TsaE